KLTFFIWMKFNMDALMNYSSFFNKHLWGLSSKTRNALCTLKKRHRECLCGNLQLKVWHRLVVLTARTQVLLVDADEGESRICLSSSHSIIAKVSATNVGPTVAAV